MNLKIKCNYEIISVFSNRDIKKLKTNINNAYWKFKKNCFKTWLFYCSSKGAFKKKWVTSLLKIKKYGKNKKFVIVSSGAIADKNTSK